jgi:nitrogen fixation-related uncharacterized protein
MDVNLYWQIPAALVAGGAIVYTFFWAYGSRGNSDAKKETVDTLSALVDSQRRDIDYMKQTQEGLAKKYDATTAQLNQQIGKVQILQETLALRDPDFNKNITNILQELSNSRKELVELRKNFSDHYAQDTNNFDMVFSLLKDGFSENDHHGEVLKKVNEIHDSIQRGAPVLNDKLKPI